MDVESYATQEVFGLITPSLPANGRDQNIALVDIGAHVTHFYVLRNNQFLFSRDQAFGGNQLTQDIQRAFNLSPEEAESAKKNQGLPENYDSDVLQPFMETLALEITRALQFFFTSTSHNQVDQVVLAGGCAALPGIDELVAKRAGVATVDRQPVRRDAGVGAHPAAPARAGRADAADRDRARAAELRIMAGIRINLLPHREQKRQARQRQFISLALSLAVLGLAIVALVHGILAAQIENQKDRNALLKKEIAKLDEQIKEIDRLRDQIQAVLARKQVVETLQANRSEAVHLLDQLVRQLPDGIYLRSVKQIGPKVTVAGLCPVERAGVHADAQHRGVARGSPIPNSSRSSWCRRPVLPADRDLKINEFTLNFLIKRAAPTEVKAPARRAKGAPPRRRPAPRQGQGPAPADG